MNHEELIAKLQLQLDVALMAARVAVAAAERACDQRDEWRQRAERAENDLARIRGYGN